jgi:hypothetical protein
MHDANDFVADGAGVQRRIAAWPGWQSVRDIG